MDITITLSDEDVAAVQASIAAAATQGGDPNQSVQDWMTSSGRAVVLNDVVLAYRATATKAVADALANLNDSDRASVASLLKVDTTAVASVAATGIATVQQVQPQPEPPTPAPLTP